MLPGVEAGDVRAIHRTRVASRRLRELLPLLELESKTARKLARRLKKTTRQLGGVREVDVLLMLTEELSASGSYPDRAIRRVAADIRAARDKARKSSSVRKSASELHRLAKSLEKVRRGLEGSEDKRAGHGWRWAMDARLARRVAFR
jgi:CHAD domain-containing protein